jgi:pSer/pThr/pTyr-binding forkhead associated (FHA) protein
MDSGQVSVIPVSDGWMRIGRSRSADLRLDDPTVSRRHAIVVRTDQGRIRALDDRSLNGVYVNGKRVDWSPLKEGDELRIGRYSLYLVEAS